MKLKTLKDIEKMPYAEINRLVGTKELRQSAIEWINNLEYTKYEGHGAILLWIKHFFNLTEEDLK